MEKFSLVLISLVCVHAHIMHTKTCCPSISSNWQVEYKENLSVINTTILFRHNRLNAFGGFNNLMPVSETKIDIFVVIVWDGLT